MTRALYWMRNDLRLTSNPLFQKAFFENEALVCVYVHDPRQFDRTIISIPRMGWHRRRFLSETLHNLDADLRIREIEFLQMWGEPEQVLPKLLEELNIDTIYFSRECAPEERSIESYLCARLDPARIKVVSAWSGFLIPPNQLPFTIAETPDVFSDYRRRLEKIGLENLVSGIADLESSSDNPTAQTPKITTAEYRSLQNIAKSSFPAESWVEMFPEESELLRSVGEPQGPREKMNVLRGGEKNGKERVEDYIFSTRSIASYFETRNGLLGLNDSTLFSAWLSNGSLSPSWIFEKVRAYESQFGASKNSEWVVVELLWRDFFKLMLLKHDVKLFLPQGIHGQTPLRTPDKRATKTRLQKILTANTAQRFINANMRELIQTGFMSNRGRQNVASYMIHELQIPWTLGAWCFESLLIDYDPASNWGNWAYLAGVGNDPRGSRVFNIQKQQDMYDPEGRYVEAWS